MELQGRDEALSSSSPSHRSLAKDIFLAGMSESWAQVWTACFFNTGEYSCNLSGLHSFALGGFASCLLPCAPAPFLPAHHPLKALQPPGSLRCLCWDWSPEGIFAEVIEALLGQFCACARFPCPGPYFWLGCTWSQALCLALQGWLS